MKNVKLDVSCFKIFSVKKWQKCWNNYFISVDVWMHTTWVPIVFGDTVKWPRYEFKDNCSVYKTGVVTVISPL